MEYCARVAALISRPPLWCTLLACAVILAARRPDLVRSPQLWAEDGTVFFLQAHTSPWSSLFTPSAGYLHTVLRLIAATASWWDPVLAPTWYVFGAAMLTLYVAARTQSSRFGLPPSPLYAFAVVLVPDAFEVLLTLTNLQWVLAAGLLALLLSKDPESPRQWLHDAVALVLLGLTGPFIVAWLPLFAWRAYRRRTRASVVLAAIAAACAVTQALTIWLNPMQMTVAPVAWDQVLAVPGVRVGASLVLGGNVTIHAGLGVATALGIVTLAGVIALGAARGAARLERLLLAAAFLALLVIVWYRCRYVISAVVHGAGSRYVFPLQLIGLWLLVAAARATDNVWVARVAGIALFAALALNLPRLREPPLHDLRWAEYAARIRAGERVAARINPDGWEFTVPGRDAAQVTSSPGVASFPAVTRLANVSMRCSVSAERPAMVGFYLDGQATRRLLVRAVGPSLANFGVACPVARPRAMLLVHEQAGLRELPICVAGATPETIAEAARGCGAFPLAPNAADVAGIVELGPGTYSLKVETADAGAGEVLIEVYELAEAPS